MRVSIVGAGALGSVYGVRLACRGGCDVEVVGRRDGPRRRIRLEREEDGEILEWTSPPQVDRVSATADVAIVCVRYEDLEGLVPRLSGTSAVPVVMTPMMPSDRDRLARALGRPLLAGMPSALAYETSAGGIRYWLPRVATTWIERGSPPGPEQELTVRLNRAGVSARQDGDVLARNAATTVSFVPLAMALDVGGSVDAVLADSALLSLAIDAAAEGRELGRNLGKAEAWASTVLRFAGPLALRLGVGVARSRSPEIITYVEKHFGRKLHAQNVVMAERIVALAAERGTRRKALTKLLDRLRGETGERPLR